MDVEQIEDLLPEIIAKLSEARVLIERSEANANRHVIVVLDDGDTFGAGCQFVLIPDGWEVERTGAMLSGDDEVEGDSAGCLMLCEF